MDECVGGCVDSVTVIVWMSVKVIVWVVVWMSVKVMVWVIV